MLDAVVLAAIDIGTNSVKTTVGSKIPGQPVTILSDSIEITGLGTAVDGSGKLDVDSVQRTLEAVADGVRKAQASGALHIAVAGTSALRDAANRAEFTSAIEQILQGRGSFEIVSGMREATLVYGSVKNDPDLDLILATGGVSSTSPAVLAVLDIGGGSTEVVLGHGSAVTFQDSLQLGAIRMTERANFSDPPTEDELRGARKAIAEVITGIPSPNAMDLAPQVTLVCSGGTIVNLAAIEAARSLPIEQPVHIRPEQLHGTRMSVRQIEILLDALVSLTSAERRRVRGLEPERADSIIAGGLIQIAAMRRLDVTFGFVSTRGMRFGLLYEQFGTEW